MPGRNKETYEKHCCYLTILQATIEIQNLNMKLDC